MSNFSNKLVNNFPEYLFNEINKQKLEARKNGRDVIDLGYGNPDIPTHTRVVDKLIESAQNKKNHKYWQNSYKVSLRWSSERQYNYIKNNYH